MAVYDKQMIYITYKTDDHHRMGSSIKDVRKNTVKIDPSPLSTFVRTPSEWLMNINDVSESATIFPCPCKLTFDLLTLKMVSESCVTWATCVPILVFLGLSVLKLFPMYMTDRQTDVRQTDIRQHHRLMPPPRRVGA